MIGLILVMLLKIILCIIQITKLGKFKNELVTKDYWSEMDEIIFIKSKVYSFKSECKSKMTNKGSMRVVMKYDVTHQDYENCLDYNFQNYINYINYKPYYKTNDLNIYTTSHRIASDKLEMYVYENRKLTLSNYDDKRIISTIDGITTYPLGFFD